MLAEEQRRTAEKGNGRNGLKTKWAGKPYRRMEAAGHNHICRDALAHRRLHPAYVVCSERQVMAMLPGVTQALNNAAE